jgi:hypothetical protein
VRGVVVVVVFVVRRPSSVVRRPSSVVRRPVFYHRTYFSISYIRARHLARLRSTDPYISAPPPRSRRRGPERIIAPFFFSGVGDTFGTCFGPLSRNRKFGYRLGKGETPEEIRASMTEVAEGVDTSIALVKMIKARCKGYRLDLKVRAHPIREAASLAPLVDRSVFIRNPRRCHGGKLLTFR